MNIMDIVILAVLGVSVIFGMYRGFISGVLSVAALIGAAAAAFAVSPSLAAWLQGNETLVNTLMYYTDAGSRIKDLDLSLLSVSQVSQSSLAQIIESAQLPAQFQTAFINAVGTAPASTTMSTLLTGLLYRGDVYHSSDLLCVRAAGSAPSGCAGRRRVRTGARRAAAVHLLCAGSDYSGGRSDSADYRFAECVASRAAV